MIRQAIANAYEVYVLNKKNPLLDVYMSRLMERYYHKRQKVDIRYDSFLQTLAHHVINVEESKKIN